MKNSVCIQEWERVLEENVPRVGTWQAVRAAIVPLNGEFLRAVHAFELPEAS